MGILSTFKAHCSFKAHIVSLQAIFPSIVTFPFPDFFTHSPPSQSTVRSVFIFDTFPQRLDPRTVFRQPANYSSSMSAPTGLTPFQERLLTSFGPYTASMVPIRSIPSDWGPNPQSGQL